MANQIRVLLADDHPLARKGIAALLKTRKNIVVVGEAADGEEAVEKTQELMPDVVILDAIMPNVSGLDATKIIRDKFPNIRILILTGYENEEHLFQIIKAGAGGYILKTAGVEELSQAVEAVAEGKKFFSVGLSQLMVEGYMRRAQTEGEPRPYDEVPLTKREKEILKLVAEGMTNQEISEKLFISPRTVDSHRTNIMKKVNIHDIALLVRYAVDHGIIEGKK